MGCGLTNQRGVVFLLVVTDTFRVSKTNAIREQDCVYKRNPCPQSLSEVSLVGATIPQSNAALTRILLLSEACYELNAVSSLLPDAQVVHVRLDDAERVRVAHAALPTLHYDDGIALVDDVQLHGLGETPLGAAGGGGRPGGRGGGGRGRGGRGGIH